MLYKWESFVGLFKDEVWDSNRSVTFHVITQVINYFLNK